MNNSTEFQKRGEIYEKYGFGYMSFSHESEMLSNNEGTLFILYSSNDKKLQLCTLESRDIEQNMPIISNPKFEIVLESFKYLDSIIKDFLSNNTYTKK